MRTRGHRLSWRWVLVGLTAGVFVSATAAAQEWLPPQGEAWLSLGYGNAFATKHYFGVVGPSGEIDAGHVRSQGFALQVGYGVTDSLTLSLGIPYFDNVYYCTSATVACTPHEGPGAGNADNGTYHGSAQDFRLAVDYQLVKGEFSLAPFAAAIIPSHGYVYFAHSAPGKDLHQYLLGFTAGGSLERLLPAAYVVASYDYAFVEQVLGFNLNRSDFTLELGYFMTFWTPALGVRFLGNGYYTHGGVPYNNPFQLLALPNGEVLFQHHDQIGKTRSVQLGGGLTYQLSGSTIVNVSYLRSVYGRDILKLNQGVSFGVTWNFSPQQLVRRFFSPKPPTSAPQGQ